MTTSRHDKALMRSHKGNDGETSQAMIRLAVLPDPEELTAYGLIDPTFPHTIIKMAVDEQAHRHAFNMGALKSSVVVTILMIICALVLSFGVFYIAYLCIKTGNAAAATIIKYFCACFNYCIRIR